MTNKRVIHRSTPISDRCCPFCLLFKDGCVPASSSFASGPAL